MSKFIHKPSKVWKRWGVPAVLSLGMLLLLTAPSWSKSKDHDGKRVRTQSQEYGLGVLSKDWGISVPDENPLVIGRRGKNYGNLSPEEKARVKRWKSLSPEKQEQLRKRMEQWKKLAPEERGRYEERYHQWQKLPPEEREKIRRRLDKWNNLPPEEKEQIRRKFR